MCSTSLVVAACNTVQQQFHQTCMPGTLHSLTAHNGVGVSAHAAPWHLLACCSWSADCREVQQQVAALQHAQAELAAERDQLSAQQQLIAQQRQHAVQQVQEAAEAHSKLLAQLRRAHSGGLLVGCIALLAVCSIVICPL